MHELIKKICKNIKFFYIYKLQMCLLSRSKDFWESPEELSYFLNQGPLRRYLNELRKT
jgi:hypothetical protein